MTRSTSSASRVGRSLAGVELVVAALGTPDIPVRAQAAIVRFSGTQTETFTAPLEGCLPDDLVGTVALTETSSGQVVDTGNNVLVVHGVNAYDYRLDLPDGRYGAEGARPRYLYAYVANPPRSIFNLVTQDQRTIFAAEGTPVERCPSTQAFRSHTTTSTATKHRTGRGRREV